MKIIGAQRHLNRLRKASATHATFIYSALYAGADIIRTEAALSITQGAIQGKGHIPSLPGEPPNRDTGQLDTSIHVRGNKARNRVDVVADAPYALALELGTSKMAERPFMRPALKKARPQIDKLVNAAIRKHFT